MYHVCRSVYTRGGIHTTTTGHEPESGHGLVCQRCGQFKRLNSVLRPQERTCPACLVAVRRIRGECVDNHADDDSTCIGEDDTVEDDDQDYEGGTESENESEQGVAEGSRPQKRQRPNTFGRLLPPSPQSLMSRPLALRARRDT